jgi:anti-sigma factor RsiW
MRGPLSPAGSPAVLEASDVDCLMAFHQLSAALDGELSEAEDAALRHHLAGCNECRRRQQILETTQRAFRRLPPPDRPIGFDASVFRRRRQPPTAALWLSLAAGMAAALTVLFVRPPAAPRPTGPAPSRNEASAVPGALEGPMNAEHALGLDCGQPQSTVCVADRPCAHGECGGGGARVALAAPQLSFAASP